MNIVLVHPTGNLNVRAIISTLDKAGMLVKFYTTVAANHNSFLLNMLPEAIRQEWLRRTFPLSSKKIKTNPFLELSRVVLPKVGFKSIVKDEYGWASVDAVYKELDKKVASDLYSLVREHLVNAVYAYEDGALATFLKAKELGLKCIYELPIAYWEVGRKLLNEEAERLPNWKVTLGGGIQDSLAKLERKTQELELADIVICPGQFVLDSLPTWAKEKQLIVAPFGSPESSKTVEENVDNLKLPSKRPLRVLFAGSMSQRKGLGDLFTAIRILNSPEIELVVMGTLQAPIEFYKNELPNFTYEPGRPHDQVLKLMKSCDIFCLPSIVEGRALVMQEAMSQGLPLIITPNTGGADLIQEGRTGFLVPIRSPEAIAEKLLWFLENRSEIPKMGKLAQGMAAQFTWESYGTKVVSSLKQFIH